MEPDLNRPRVNHEAVPSLPSPTQEVVPERQPEVSPERQVANFERESSPTQTPIQAAPDPVVPVLPMPMITTDDTATDDAVIGDVPDVAADDDLIEKEWVNKAKQIISQTVDDPHAREEAIGQLHREYLRKRYGKELGVQ